MEKFRTKKKGKWPNWPKPAETAQPRPNLPAPAAQHHPRPSLSLTHADTWDPPVRPPSPLIAAAAMNSGRDYLGH